MEHVADMPDVKLNIEKRLVKVRMKRKRKRKRKKKGRKGVELVRLFVIWQE